MGVRTKVIPLMKEYNNAAPIFDATEDYLRTTLPAFQARGTDAHSTP
jgi:ATP-dependent DNA helicase RecG